VGEVKITGSVNGRIIEAVEEKRIDLIAIASHNPRMTDYLIGSHAAHVVLHAPCTVLVVR
jgi:universal stress protein F